MSERYGTFGEMPELLQSLEGWLNEEIEEATERLRTAAIDPQYDPRYDAGRLQAFRDVLDFIIVNPGG